MLVEELPNARLIEATSILEWRIRPERLDDELGEFLDEVWGSKGGRLSRRSANGSQAEGDPESEAAEAG